MTYDATARIDNPHAATERALCVPDLREPPHIDLGALAHSLSFRMRKAQLALQRRGLRSVGEVGIGPAEFGTLVLCEQNPGLAQFQIAAALDIDKASVVAVVDRLEQMGWLLRRRSNHDRRRYGLCLTSEGQRQVQSLRREAGDAESFASELFTPEELDLLLRLLARMAG